MVDITSLLAASLDGRDVDARTLATLDADAILEAAERHDIVPLVAHRLLAIGNLPATLESRLHSQARAAAIVDLVREAEVRRFFTAIDIAGVRALLLKGSHLAYTHYARPDLRARVDTDVLIARDARAAVHTMLTTSLGYVPAARVSNDLTAPQQAYSKRLPLARHTFDIHWELTSPRVFASMPSFEDLLERSERLPALGPAARVPAATDALLLACVHRVAHHLDAGDLKWLYDIHLLAGALSASEWDRFVGLVRVCGFGAVSQHSLDRATEVFGTRVPDTVRHGGLSANSAEPSASYLTPKSLLKRVIDDARTLSWRDRVRLAQAHLLPSEGYMRSTWAPGSRLPLAWLYTERVLRGLGGWLAHPERPSRRR